MPASKNFFLLEKVDISVVSDENVVQKIGPGQILDGHTSVVSLDAVGIKNGSSFFAYADAFIPKPVKLGIGQQYFRPADVQSVLVVVVAEP